MNINEISPYIRVAWDHTLKGGEDIGPRINYDYELIYFQNGSGVITIEDRSYDIVPGDIFLLRPGIPHGIYPYRDGFLHQPHIHFDLFCHPDSPTVNIPFKLPEHMTADELSHIREDMLKDPEYNLPERIRVRNTGLFEELFYAVIKAYSVKGTLHDIRQKALFLNLFLYLLEEFEWSRNPTAPSEQQDLEKVRKYICQKARTSLSLDELSQNFNLSKYYLTRIFKNYYGISPIHYHQKLRMEHIREAILYTNQNLGDIAESFGYESASVFSRAFRASEGISPSFLRKGMGGSN